MPWVVCLGCSWLAYVHGGQTRLPLSSPFGFLKEESNNSKTRCPTTHPSPPKAAKLPISHGANNSATALKTWARARGRPPRTSVSWVRCTRVPSAASRVCAQRTTLRIALRQAVLPVGFSVRRLGRKLPPPGVRVLRRLVRRLMRICGCHRRMSRCNACLHSLRFIHGMDGAWVWIYGFGEHCGRLEGCDSFCFHVPGMVCPGYV